MRLIFALAITLLSATVADAQIFQRFRSRFETQSNCPGGVCPTPQSQGWTNRDGLTPRAHVEHVHGTSTAGMTEIEVRQHQNDYHNRFGAGHPVRGFVAAHRDSAYGTSSVIVRTSAALPTYGSTGSVTRTSYGSAGSVVTRSVPTYGSAGSAPVVTYYAPTPTVINTTPAVQARSIVQRGPQEVRLGLDGFRSSLSRAVADARRDGTLKPREAIRMQVRMLSPAFVEQAHDLAVTQIAFSGEVSAAVPMDAEGKVQVANIQWDQLIEFLEKLLPLLLQLFSAFGL